MMKFRNLLFTVAAVASVTAPIVASATSPRREAVLYNKEQKQNALAQKQLVKQQYENGEITKEQKKQQVQDLKDQIQEYADTVDELKATK